MSDDDRVDDLDDALDAASADTEWALQGELLRAEPDFGDVIRRARELDPEAVSEEQARAAGRIPVAPRLSADERGTSPSGSESSLRMHIAALQAEADADVEARQLQAIPNFVPPERPVREPSRWVVGAIAAAAAVVALAWGIPRVTEATNLAQAEAASQAESARSNRDAAGQAKRGRPVPAVDAVAPAPAPVPMTAQVHLPEGEGEPATSAPLPGHERERPGSSKASPSPRKAPPGDIPPAPAVDPLAELDARAQQLWREGDLAGAEAVFREILARAPRSRHAELAYGDLFTLVGQRGKTTELEPLWRDYLAVYPRGRFADDARAELCARESDPACWSTYLEDFPSGAHVERAKRAAQVEP